MSILLPAILGTAIGASIAALLGIAAFFRQKEYESVRQRYLVECIDLICKNIDYALGVFLGNWAQALRLHRDFRDLEKTVDPESYSKQFIKFNYEHFTITPFFRLRELINDQIFWEAAQSLFSFIETSYTFFDSDFRIAVKFFVEGKIDEDKHRDMIDGYLEKIIGQKKKSLKFYLILEELLNIGRILEKERFSFKRIRDFKDKLEVKESISRLRDAIGENLVKSGGKG